MKTLIIGMGTGRSGTKSLAKIIREQTDSYVAHETNPDSPGFPKNMNLFNNRFDEVVKREEQFIGDVSFYNLYYINEIIDRFSDEYNLRFLVTKREKIEVVRSYMKHSGRRNWWGENNNDYWSRFYPVCPGKNKQEQISYYWEWYYKEVEKFEHMNNLKIIDIDMFNKNSGINEILDFVGYKDKKIISVHENKRR